MKKEESEAYIKSKIVYLSLFFGLNFCLCLFGWYSWRRFGLEKTRTKDFRGWNFFIFFL